MMRFKLIIFLLLPLLLLAQDEQPQPPGGMDKFISFINDNFKLNKKVLDQDLSGEIVLEFRVSELGKLDSFNIVKDIGEQAAFDLIKAIRKGGDWIPATSNEGTPIASWVTLPYVPAALRSFEQSAALSSEFCKTA